MNDMRRRLTAGRANFSASRPRNSGARAFVVLYALLDIGPALLRQSGCAKQGDDRGRKGRRDHAKQIARWGALHRAVRIRQ
jgi:hypothetical protein